MKRRSSSVSSMSPEASGEGKGGKSRPRLLSIVIGAIAKAVSTPAHPVHLNAGFSINGWLAVILTLVLARVFAEGALMREAVVHDS